MLSVYVMFSLSIILFIGAVFAYAKAENNSFEIYANAVRGMRSEVENLVSRQGLIEKKFAAKDKTVNFNFKSSVPVDIINSSTPLLKRAGSQNAKTKGN